MADPDVHWEVSKVFVRRARHAQQRLLLSANWFACESTPGLASKINVGLQNLRLESSSPYYVAQNETWLYKIRHKLQRIRDFGMCFNQKQVTWKKPVPYMRRPRIRYATNQWKEDESTWNEVNAPMTVLIRPGFLTYDTRIYSSGCYFSQIYSLYFMSGGSKMKFLYCSVPLGWTHSG